MSIQLTDEQLMIRSMVRDFAREVVAPEAARRDHDKQFPGEILKQMGELGLMGMMIPAELGGSGADTVSYVLALSEIASACASTAVVMSVQNSIVCESLYRMGSDDQHHRFLKPLAQGEAIGAFALTEPNAGSDPVSQKTKAVRDGDTYILTGTKRFITTGKNADVVIVTAVTDPAKRHKGITAFIVPRDTPGFKVGSVEDKMGLRASDTTDLNFDDCPIPADQRLGQEGQGFELAMKGLDGGRIGIAAQSIGVAQAALDAAVSYAQEREQFGVKISKFQGLRWMIADMATELEAARQLTYSAAAMKDRGESYTQQASMAKLFASEMVNRVTAQALQIHGGYGYTK
ncbi:MAG: acyl-CoA dehydrogenase family protein, partial [Desulfobacteraceae bacterium]